LALKSDFNLTDAFKIFDRDYRGLISIAELRDGLSAIGVFPTSEEAELFVTRYDDSNDRRLTAREFE
jgi:Ca2+-binding EF-hand superfamily protein